jgi:hypothetical protein
MPTYFDLKRGFVERPKYNPDELLASEVRGKLLGWDKVLDSRISLVIAPANYGKTTEMRERVAQQRASSKVAVFVALRKLADRGGFEKALEIDERNVYDAWKVAPTVPLTLFVDSLDEASASSVDGIEYLVGDIAREVGWPNGLVRWVISTRPAVLSATVLDTLKSILVVPSVVAVNTAPGAIGAADSSSSTSESAIDPELRFFSMVSLDSSQAKIYLTSKYPSLDVIALLRVARQLGLSGYATSPGGLDILANIRLDSIPPTSLTEAYQRVVDAVQAKQRTDARIEAAGGANSNDLAQAAQKLASASQVCRLPNIELADDTLVVTDGILSVRAIAGDLLSDRVLRQLLNTQLFNDAGFNQVKFYPDEILPFLGAQRLAGLVQSPEQAHQLVQHFTWKAPTGEQGVYREFLPLMGWLATLNQYCREELLQRDPQALAFFGDLRNSHVQLGAAKAALRESIRRLVDQGDRLGRGVFILTSENFWQAGRPEFTSLLKNLFQQYGSHHWARDALLDIATNSHSDALRMVVLKECGGSYRQLMHRSIDLRYILERGRPEDLAGLAAALKADDTASESLVATLIAQLGWHHLKATEMAALIHKQFRRGGGGFHISYAFDSGLREDASDEQLYALCRALVVRVARLRGGKGSLVGSSGRLEDRYVELATETLGALVSRISFGKHRRVALLCLVMQRFVNVGHIGLSNLADLRHAFRENAPVRLEFLSLIIKSAGQNESKLWTATYGYLSLCEVTAADVETMNSAELKAVVKKHEEAQAAQCATPQPTPRSREERLTVSDGVKKELLDMIEKLRDGSAANALAWIARWLLQTNPSSSYGEVKFDVFEREVGSKIAQAVREGFGKYWRNQPPKFKEGEPGAMYHTTVAGLQGLHLELGEGEHLPTLAAVDVRIALRYAVFEINGYPKWFWPLVKAHQEVACQELTQMVIHANDGAVSLEHAETLLTSLGNASPAIRDKLAPLAWTFILERPKLRDYVVEKVLTIATEVPGVVSQKEFVSTAWAKIKNAFSGPMPSEEEKAKVVQAERKQSVVWAASWLIGYPTTFRKDLERWLKKTPADARALIFELAAYLGMDRGSKLVRLAKTGDEGVPALSALYKWTMEVVRPEKDNVHTDGESYTPDDRDYAEQLRDALIPTIAAAKSQLAYDVLDQLRLATTEPRASYLRKLQFEMREAQYARPPLAQQKYNHFERSFTADVTDTVSFAMKVHSDLLAVKYDIENGEYSLRRFFTEVVFKRGTTKAEKEKEGLALESHFQQLLASELHHHSKDRYSVTVEPHTAEAKRRDVLCSKGSMFVSIELKMSMYWPLEKYVEALDRQLVGQYMRHRNATTGFLVIVLQEKGRNWNDPTTGKKVDFKGLLTMLSNRALELEAKDRRRFLRVIGIDATQPENFRRVKKRTSKKSAAAKNSLTKSALTGRASAPIKRASVANEKSTTSVAFMKLTITKGAVNKAASRRK